ncbi:MAG: stealth family protein [Alistipes sp.]|nr:stealth family protein [Alistipes senegalensis]MCM1249562.1 stealth family protein [Alistipes sp.]
MEQNIDVVIPWVDDRDPKWRQERRRHSSDFIDKPESLDKFFRDWNTLLYVFRGIEKFMPWVDKVHLLTYGHVPEWLDVQAEKLHVVRHADFYLNPLHLPTFNSQSIEMNLLGIEGLADRFIYFNDDTLVLKETPVSRFFDNGKPLDFLIQGIPRQGFLYKLLISNDSYVYTMSNNLRLINESFSKKQLLKANPSLFYSRQYSLSSRLMNRFFNLFPKYYWFSNYHFQQPYLKSELQETYDLYGKTMDLTSSSRFRQRHDVNQYLYRYVRLAKGEFVPYEPNDTYSMVLSSYKNFRKNRDKIYRARFFCPNDSPSISEADYVKIKQELTGILDMILPEKSSFEK